MDKTRKPYPEKARERIRNGKVLSRLLKHFNGEIELTQSQVNVGLALMKKVTPDLKQSEQHHTGDVKYQVFVSAEADKAVDEKLESEY